MPHGFAPHAASFRWTAPPTDLPGLRPPQLGALHTIAGRFAQPADPALVVMPTGSGKTAVLQATPYVLGARRALVLTPSRLVREQIARGFRTLQPLRALAALPDEVPAPRVHAVRGRVAPAGGWEAFRDFDVVVGTPHSLSPVIRDVPVPPPDLFDVVLVDEAHHSAARSWATLLSALPSSRQVLFTATPFRRDRGGLPGDMVFTYSLRAALRDGVFGQLVYEPVVPPADDPDPDAALARAAAARVRQDQTAGYTHWFMARTGSRARAADLLALYERETDLRLQRVTGADSLRHIGRVLTDLRRGALDGIVCVDMLGEGVDLPNLKVAALHTPHRSLAVALQFVGRFARTTAPSTGRATFLAVASDLEVERTRLYAQGAGWDEMIPNLSDGRLRREQETQAVLATFAPAAGADDGQSAADAPLADVSLRALLPYHHVKVYRGGADIDVTRPIAFPPGTDVRYRQVSSEARAAVYITRTVVRPQWTSDPRFDTVAHDLLVIYADAATGLLFVCSTDRSAGFYDHLADQLTPPGGPAPRGLSLAQLNKVLLDLRDTRLYNLGMRNAVAGNRTESYRTTSGNGVEQGVDPSHGRTFRRGHYMGTALEGAGKVTIGVSTASKVWENAATPIPDLLRWCRRIAVKLASTRVPRTNTGLDHLATGEEAARVPDGVMFADWHPSAYETPLRIKCTLPDRSVRHAQLLDLDLQVETADADTVRVVLAGEDVAFRATFRVDGVPFFCADPSNATDVVIVGGREERSVLAYLNSHPPTFHTADFASLEGRNLFPALPPDVDAYDRARIETVLWEDEGVDITEEVGPPGSSSIHAYLERRLAASDATVVVYDHGAGEMADFVAVTLERGVARIALYHAKGSGGAAPGSRVGDAYEVCGQAIKSTHWAERRRILSHVEARLRRAGGATRFVKGDVETLRTILGDGAYVRVSVDVVIVQPGFSAADLSSKILSLFAAAEAFLLSGRCSRLHVLGSR